MNHVFNGQKQRKPRILVAPLDWGLGHATRCIPLIRALLQEGAEPWLCGEGAQEILLKGEFPDLPFLSLQGYRIRYGQSALGLLQSLFFQVPQILRAIKREHAWLKKVVAEHDIDAVISDNRYGMYQRQVPSVFITHQLTIKSPFGKWTENILRKRNYKYINRFTTCWVPDHAGKNNLAGDLSHPAKLPAIPLQYIGWLSRMEPPAVNSGYQKDHLLVILSGPEPQRSLLENQIIREVAHYHATAVVVRGIPGESALIPSSNMIRFYNHLSAAELNKEMEKAEFVISRSGYSTIMDIVQMEKKSILIPTPGQTEQEYLASFLEKKQLACCSAQKSFSLSVMLQKAKKFNYHFPERQDSDGLSKAISKLIADVTGR